MSLSARRLLICVAVVTAELSAEQEQKRAEAEAAAAHEARAQKALSDSLTDALAMLKHGSARAKESAAAGIAQLAIETTMCAAHPAAACLRPRCQPSAHARTFAGRHM